MRSQKRIQSIYFWKMDFHQNKKMLKPEEAATKDRIQIDYDDAKDEIAAEFIFCIHQEFHLLCLEK